MRKSKFHRILTIFISVCLCMLLIPVRALLADNASSDADFQMNGTTLTKYTGTASTVSIPSFVKEIGNHAFEGNQTITSVTIGQNVTKIGNYAFHGCSFLKKVDIGNSVTSIGNSAFAECTSLTNVKIGSGVIEVGNCSFGGCTSLSTITISSGNTYLSCKRGALYGNQETELIQVLAGRSGETYTMPDTVTSIYPYCMWGCERIKTLSFSGGISTIPEYAFYHASGLQFVDIPDSVSAIELRAFGGNQNLMEVMIALSVMNIHESAFEDSPNVSFIVARGSLSEKYAIKQNIPVKASSQYAGTYNFSLENNNPESGAIDQSGTNNTLSSNNNAGSQTQTPDLSTVEGAWQNSQTTANGDIDHLKNDELGATFIVSGNAFVMLDTDSVVIHDGDDYTSQTGSTVGTNNNMPVILPNGSYGKYTIFDYKIAERAYYDNQELSYYVIPDGVTGIGELSFAGSSLTGIAIPDSVTKIGFGAFANCTKLAYVTIPKQIQEIEPYAFENTKWKNDWLSGGDASDFYIAGDGILLFYKGNQPVVNIPDTVKQIAGCCFQNHTEITQITLPDSLKTIGEQAFEGCSQLRTVNGGVNLEIIKDRAFSGCPLDTIRIPATVKEIGLGAFDYSAIERKTAVSAVFMGTELPVLSYSDSAKKLTNSDARHRALEGVSVAILWKGDQCSFQDSVISNEKYGFSGVICKILTEADTNVTGTLQIISAGSGFSQSDLPESVWVYGNRYVITDPNNVLKQKMENQQTKPEFLVCSDNIRDTFLENYEAKGSCDLADYKLTAGQGDFRETHLKEILEELYQNTTISPITTFSLNLTDSSGFLPITKLDGESISVTMDIPNLLSEKNLHIVTEDEDGQLEDVPFRMIENEKRKIQFTLNHLSPFAMFNAGELVSEEEPETGIIGEGNGAPHIRNEKEVSSVTIYCVIAAVLLLMIATALWFTRRFHKVL